MGKIYDFGLFLEAKQAKEAKPKLDDNSEVLKEAKKIISEMFDVAKNISFEGTPPHTVEFETNNVEYKVWSTYDKSKDKDQGELKMDYSENVLKKRKYQVSLIFKKAIEEKKGEKSVYKLRFDIKLIQTSDIKSEKKDEELAWEFEKRPDKVIDFIKKGKQKCDWDNPSKKLFIMKSAYSKLATDQLKVLIREEGGLKVRA